MKSTNLKSLITVILSTLMINFGSQMNAENDTLPNPGEKSSERLDHVLDKLEKRLIDREDSPLTQEEEASSTQENVIRGKPQYKPKKPEKINGKTTSSKNLKEIQTKINEYDQRIEILEADLRRLRANLYDASTTDNQIVLQVRSANASKYIVRSLKAKLDGGTLYDQADTSGLWMPSKAIMLFFGPLRPGEHQLDIRATLVPTATEGLELPTWNHKSLEQTFSFTIPDGKVMKHFMIEISDPDKSASQPVAKLTEEDTK